MSSLNLSPASSATSRADTTPGDTATTSSTDFPASPPAGLLAVTALPIDAQADAFLKAFVFDFKEGKNGGFASVLDITEQFRSYLADPSDSDCEVDAAHRFLEARGEATTVRELRNKMQAIDADQNLRMALIEFLLFNYGKSVDEFLNPPFEVPEELLAALEQATTAHRAHWRERAERDALYENLERTSTVGGVKGMRAKAELAAARARNWTADWNTRELTAAAQQRKTELIVAAADKETLARQAVEAEEARLAEAAAARAAAEEARRAAGKAALRSRAAQWEAAMAAPALVPVAPVR